MKITMITDSSTLSNTSLDDEMDMQDKDNEAYQLQEDNRRYYDDKDAEQAEQDKKDNIAKDEEKYRQSANDGDNAVTLADDWVLEAQMSGPQHEQAFQNPSRAGNGTGNQYHEPSRELEREYPTTRRAS